MRRPWTPEEDQQLRDGYSNLTSADLAGRLGRTTGATRARIKRLGLSKEPNWSAQEDAILRATYPHHRASWVADQLGRSEASVHIRAASLNISSTRWRLWEQYEIDFLQKNHGVMSYKDLGERLYRSSKSVAAMAAELGLSGLKPQRNSP